MKTYLVKFASVSCQKWGAAALVLGTVAIFAAAMPASRSRVDLQSLTMVSEGRAVKAVESQIIAEYAYGSDGNTAHSGGSGYIYDNSGNTYHQAGNSGYYYDNSGNSIYSYGHRSDFAGDLRQLPMPRKLIGSN